MQCENIDVNASQVTFVLPGIEMTHRWCSLDTMGVRVGWQCCLGDDNDGEVSEQGSSYVQLLVTCRTRSLNSSWGQ